MVEPLSGPVEGRMKRSASRVNVELDVPAAQTLQIMGEALASAAAAVGDRECAIVDLGAYPKILKVLPEANVNEHILTGFQVKV